MIEPSLEAMVGRKAHDIIYNYVSGTWREQTSLRASCRYWEWIFSFMMVIFTFLIRQEIFDDFYEKHWAFSSDQMYRMARAQAVLYTPFISIMTQAVVIFFWKPFSISLKR